MPNSKNITFDQLQSALTRVKNSLDKKANTSHGNHVPKTETANNARFLRNDNTWQTITPVNIGAADRSHNHTSLTGVTSLQFAAASSDHATIKVTTDGGSAANTYLDFEMDDDAGSDMFRWRFNAWDSSASAATGQFNLMTLSAKDTTSARLTVNGDVTASSFSGNATSATKLQSARALKIGNTSKNFDGTGNVTWTLSEIGAAASSHGHSYLPLSGGTISNSGFKSLSIQRSGSTNGASIEFKNSNGTLGYIGMEHSANGGLMRWSADTNTVYTVLDSGNFNTYAAAKSHGTHVTYATATPLVAGTAAVGTSGKVAREDHVHPAQTSVSGSSGSCTGNAATATKLQTARKLTIGNTGKTFNGTADVAWSLSEIGAASSGHVHTNIKFLDKRAEDTTPANVSEGVSLHLKSTGKAGLNDGGDYYASLFLKPWNDISGGPYANIAVTGNQNMWVRTATSDSAWNNWKQIAFTSSSITGNAATATKLQNARNIKIGNTTRSFNGTADVTWTLSDIGAAAASHGTHVTWSTTTPKANGTAAVGTEAKVARGDHVHPAQTTVSGNAGTATKLQTARAINGTSFDGSKDITTANWGTTRTFTIGKTAKSVNGSSNMTWSTSEILHQGTITTQDWNTANVEGVYAIENFSGSNSPTGAYQWGGLLTLRSGNVTNQVYLTHSNNEMWIRGGWGGTWNGSWSKVYTTSYKPSPADIGAAAASHGNHVPAIQTADNTKFLRNDNTWATVTPANIGAANVSHGTHVTYGGNGSATTVSRSDHTHSYIPLGGSSSITGNLEFSNSGTTARGVIGTMGDNDYWRIVGGATASNSGYLEIATADDANEPIYVRQYGSGKFGTLTRTATLLDASGNTSFPGTVAASAFNGNASTATKLQTARKINDVSFDGSADVVIPIKFWKSTVGDNNSKPYHRILTTGVVTSQWTDKVITVMASGNYDGGPFGIFRVVLRTNGTNSDSSIKIQWMIRNGFNLDSIVANFIKTNGSTQADIFYKCPGTYASVTWTILGEGDRSSGNYYTSWTKINTAATTTEVYTEAEMKALKSYTSTLLKGTDVAHVNESNTSAQLTTARTINGTSFNGTANITTANWGTGRTLTIGNTGKSVNGSGNVSWSLSEIGAAAANHTHNYAASNHTHNYAGSSSAGGNANAAVKLATARTINGTNFNGTANITTANWGTARTITIGSTGKSVNGGGNVTWTWNEMGVPKSQGNYKFGGNQNAISTAQFITLITNAGAFNQFYWISRGTWDYAGNQYINDTGCGNIHLAGCTVECIGSSSSYTIRVHTPTTSSSGVTYGDFIYVNNGKDYSPGWRRLYSNKYKPTPADIGAAAASHGNHVPATQTADNKKFLRNDNTWQTVTPANIGAAAASHSHNYAGSSSAGGNANAAVKLATARSINGTNFDGSGNITTANWGTGRTITIGNKGKTVNGSGNVSWSLSEIGALPTAGGTVSGNLAVSGAFSVGGKKITINSSAPSSPAVGDIWIKI